jgi:hypothetical protein
MDLWVSPLPPHCRGDGQEEVDKPEAPRFEALQGCSVRVSVQETALGGVNQCRRGDAGATFG